MHRQGSDARDLDQNRTKQMCHDQFDVHPQDDVGHTVIEADDQDHNHEVYQAKTYLPHPSVFVFDLLGCSYVSMKENEFHRQSRFYLENKIQIKSHILK